MKELKIYTDGACSGNPGKGGYCAILIYNVKEKIVSGSELDTTNNRMEFLAVIRGLQTLKVPCSVELFSDSQYVIDAFNKGWITNWQKNDWKTSSKTQVKNRDLWEELLRLLSIHLVRFVKVKGHSDNEYNNRCDQIAVSEYKKLG